jgi:hypothetical protein
MLEFLDDILASNLFRTLTLEPDINLHAATERVFQAIDSADLSNLDQKAIRGRLEAVSRRFNRRAVLNPIWLQQKGVRPHFWFVETQPGWLEHLVQQTQDQREGISQYILYGDYDALIILMGTDAEAAHLRETISGSAYLEPTHYSVKRSLLLYGHEPVELKPSMPEVKADVVNALAGDYDLPAYAREREALRASGVLLGPTWVQVEGPSNRIVAFVSMSLHGRHGVKGGDLLHALQAHETLRKTLIHVFEIQDGRPFDYVAKLGCSTMAELDEATNLIGYTRVGHVRVEIVTLIVARGVDQLPMYRSAAMTLSLPVAPDIRELEAIARDTISKLGSAAIERFNGLPPSDKLAVLRGLEELDRLVEERHWDDERDKAIRRAVAAFATASLAPDEEMTGAVVGIGTAVEGFLKHVIRIAAESQFGPDYGRIQKELKLQTKDLRTLTLGKALSALRVMADHPSFAYLKEKMTAESLARLSAFSDLRNRWAHEGGANLKREQAVDEARRAIADGVALIKWLHSALLPAIKSRPEQAAAVALAVLPPKRAERDFGIFVSHSSADIAVAERVSQALLALNYPVWYAEWRIEPGDSIVERIEEGLAQNDTLVILLSKNSVESRWVRRELSSAIMTQLSKQAVTIVPVLIEPCDIPPSLADIKYVDLSKDFEDGFLKLLEFLRKRKRDRQREPKDTKNAKDPDETTNRKDRDGPRGPKDHKD